MLRKPDHASITSLPDDDMLKVVCKLLETWGPEPKKAGRLGPMVLLEFVAEENTLAAYDLLKLWGFNAMMEECWITVSTRVQGNPFVDQRVFQAVFQGHLQRDAVANYQLYRDLIDEELRELDRAATPEEHLDALIDLIYVTIGAGVALRHDMQGAWNEVHRTNMAKLGPDGKPIIRESDGKVQKPEGWLPPELERFVGHRLEGLPLPRRERVIRILTAPGVGFQELANLRDMMIEGQKDPDFTVVANYPMSVEVSNDPRPRYTLDEIEAAWFATPGCNSDGSQHREDFFETLKASKA